MVKDGTNEGRHGILTIAKLNQFPAVAGIIDKEEYLMEVRSSTQLLRL